MVKKLYSLCENHLFSKAYRKGKNDTNKFVAVYVLKNYRKDSGGKAVPSQLGITVNKKLGKAVKRSRVKRVIRAAYRMCIPEIKDGYIIVVAARSAAFERKVKSTDVYAKMHASLKKLGVININPCTAENVK